MMLIVESLEVINFKVNINTMNVICYDGDQYTHKRAHTRTHTHTEFIRLNN